MATELMYGQLIRDCDERRVAREDRKTYDIKQFWQVHHEIVNLAAQGYKQTEIAYILGITPQTVSNTLNSTLGEEKLSIMRLERDADAKLMIERVRVLRDKALKVYQKLFDGVDENGNPVESTIGQQLAAADTVVLELAQMKAPTRVQTQSVHSFLSAEELAEFKSRGLSNMRASGRIIDVESEQESTPDES